MTRGRALMTLVAAGPRRVVVRVRDAGGPDEADVTVVFLNGRASIGAVHMGGDEQPSYPFPVDEAALIEYAEEAQTS